MADTGQIGTVIHQSKLDAKMAKKSVFLLTTDS